MVLPEQTGQPGCGLSTPQPGLLDQRLINREVMSSADALSASSGETWPSCIFWTLAAIISPA